uniref:Gamma glutamyltranspeptidase 1 n=1 Tax=Echinococcus granulosus TaxID=6210 RepID=A0A068W866_ECHGR|nr:gamma glutamyltranspeptidase 1 [Echinococcus granulosus]
MLTALVFATLLFAAIFPLGLRFSFLLFSDVALPNHFAINEAPLAFISPSTLGHYHRAAISSDAPGCATQGRKILERNGTIVDAAIVTLLCNGLVNPQSMGVGGGFLMVYYKASEKKAYALDARETAPSAASPNMYGGRDPIERTHGPLSIAVPSELRGYYAAWKKFGRLKWAELFQDAIKMCRKGTPITPTVDRMLATYGTKFPVGSGIWKLFYNKTEGRLKKRGELLIRPELGSFLERVAANPEDLITGRLVEEMRADLAEVQSIISLQDLIDYEPLWRAPVEMPLRAWGDECPSLRLLTTPPPSSGVLIGLALNTLASYNYTDKEGLFDGDGVLYYHRLAEVFKLIFAKRSFLTDECCMNTEEEQFLRKMMTLPGADEIAAKITDTGTHNLSYYGSIFASMTDIGTSHVSMVGPEGDGLSITSTINMPFGSGIVGSRTGILFNNEMNDFSIAGTTNFFGLPPAPAHLIRPKGRPFSSMAPIIVTDAANGTVRLVIGASGGTQIITATIQATYANLYLGMNVKGAIDSIRIHHQLLPKTMRYEKKLPSFILQGLKDLGHEISESDLTSAVQAIEVANLPCPGHSKHQCLLVNADYRKGGDHDGF